MVTIAVSFTNFGPYHLARLRALAERLGRSGGRLVAYETAGRQGLYPWETGRGPEPFEWVTLFPDRVLEDLSSSACAGAMASALDRDRPDAVAFAGYVRPECLAMLRWARGRGVPRVLMSETQAVDHPRVWWKEAVKRRRVRACSAALVGGPRHRAYLASLGMPPDRVALGYNAVDGAGFASRARAARLDPATRVGLPAAPYFLAVSRFAPEKNLSRLHRAFARYRAGADPATAWDLVLCGSGPEARALGEAVAASGCPGAIHRPGFLQADELARWYGHASAFVHPAWSEPWGLVVNEAAACALPLLVSERAGCVETFVPEGDGHQATGRRLDPADTGAIAESLQWLAALPEAERLALGRQAEAVAAAWGPERFASGAAEALQYGFLQERLHPRFAASAAG